ncbi:MAG TPA: hypothetical protein VHF06_12810 [Pseudonocardiaceae bacterium]|jgi:hypothetical protein|nr:hypothetical protein [Pseudonocardiaceae bacterium]
MYRTPAPVLERTEAPSLSIARVLHRRFGPGGHRLDDEFSTRHFTDLTASYGVPFRPDIAAAAAGNTFTSMATELMAELEPGSAELALVAHATPDVDCRLAAATYLSEVLPGGPLVFAISESGRCTPFAALRLAGDYAARHNYQRVLVFAFDQATLPYEKTAVPAANDPVGDAGAVILLGPPGEGADYTVRHVAGVTGDGAVGAAVRRELASLPRPVRVLAGPGVEPDQDLPAGVGPVERVPAGYPCTGLLGALGDHANGTALLVDHDRTTGDLALCVVGGLP